MLFVFMRVSKNFGSVRLLFFVLWFCGSDGEIRFHELVGWLGLGSNESSMVIHERCFSTKANHANIHTKIR